MSPDLFLFPDVVWFRFAIGFLCGAILGSFATMLAYRLPRHLSIVFPRSHCPSCNVTLGAYDLLPIFSWLATRGRCRHCRAKIGAKYLFIEIATSLACAIACTIIGFSLWLVIAYVGIVAIIVFVCTKIL
jgi:prepilin signal peptidase PulO-like enzyme (type II secretory pathway)